VLTQSRPPCSEQLMSPEVFKRDKAKVIEEAEDERQGVLRRIHCANLTPEKRRFWEKKWGEWVMGRVGNRPSGQARILRAHGKPGEGESAQRGGRVRSVQHEVHDHGLGEGLLLDGRGGAGVPQTVLLDHSPGVQGAVFRAFGEEADPTVSLGLFDRLKLSARGCSIAIQIASARIWTTLMSVRMQRPKVYRNSIAMIFGSKLKWYNVLRHATLLIEGILLPPLFRRTS
jgi:hypothetical protein